MTQRRSTRPWPEVTAFYRTMVERDARPLRPMLSLVEHLAGSRYARSLHAALERETLVLARAPDFIAGDNELQILFDASTRQFRFTHVPRPGAPEPWSRECGEDEWQPVLERLFHKRLQWFHEG